MTGSCTICTMQRPARSTAWRATRRRLARLSFPASLVSTGGKLVGCQACHFIQGQGRHFGPDLSKIGARQSLGQILESIVAPSISVAQQYRTTVIELRDGTTHVGFVVARDEKAISLAIATGQTIGIKPGEISAESRCRPRSWRKGNSKA